MTPTYLVKYAFTLNGKYYPAQYYDKNGMPAAECVLSKEEYEEAVSQGYADNIVIQGFQDKFRKSVEELLIDLQETLGVIRSKSTPLTDSVKANIISTLQELEISDEEIATLVEAKESKTKKTIK